MPPPAEALPLTPRLRRWGDSDYLFNPSWPEQDAYACFPHRSTSDYGPCSSQDPELSGPCQRPLCKGLPELPWPSFSQGQSSEVIPSLGTPVEPKALLGYTKQPTGSTEEAGWSQNREPCADSHVPAMLSKATFFSQGLWFGLTDKRFMVIIDP